jgi:8-oxo-dGTP diphosphatase
MGTHRKSIEIIARGALVSDGYLLVCRTAGRDVLYLPGGHVEFQEAARYALERELDEETGHEARAGSLLGVVEHTFLQDGERHSEINLVFELHIDELDAPEPPESQEPHISFHWIPLDRLSETSFQPQILRCLLPRWISEVTGADRMASSGGPWLTP